jgi:DNA polymerase III subunit gamma/tau
VIWIARPLFTQGNRLSYEVIARRWRPQDFTGLIGQDHIRTTLQNALKNDRLHHALLFTGPRGTGKTSTARILAKSLRCPQAVNFVPCNHCSECEEIASGRSLNVIEIDGASNNGVDAIRELRETVGFLPSSGKFKLYIIDEVHMLSTSAFNALLKTLEEPPEHVYFVMATTEVHKIPNTILSRCQRFDFRRIPTRVIAAHLQTICERDEVKFEADALWTIARQGDGSMRDAQSLLDQVINFTNGELRRDLVVATLGLTDRGLLVELTGALLGRATPEVLSGIQKLHQSGNDPKLFILDVMEQLRNTLLLKLGADKAMIDLPDSEIEALAKMSATLTPEDLQLFFDMALKGAQDLARASDPLLVLEMVLLRMVNAPRVDSFVTGAPHGGPHGPGPQHPTAPVSARATQSTTAGTARVPVTGTVGHSGPAQAQPQVRNMAPQASAQPSPPAANSPIELKFKELVEKIKEVNGLIGAQLENCFVVKLDGKSLNLGIAQKHKFLFDKLNQPDFKKKVGNYLNTFWGAGYTLNIQLAEPTGQTDTLSPNALTQKIEDDRQQALRKAVEAHPLVQSTQSVFKAEIKSIRAAADGGQKENKQ